MSDQQRGPRERLRKLISDADPRIGDLPLLHTSDAYRLADILEAGKLVPTPCKVFGEDLLYLFLGRPAYRTRRQTNDNIHFDLPVVIIMKSEAAIPEPKRVFPFDTGAFAAGLYKSYFHNDTSIEDFQLDNSVDGARRFISTMYSSNREYFIGSTRRNVEIPFGQFELEGLYELARAPADPLVDGRLPADERSSSVEIQFDNEISLEGNVLAIILPQQYLDIEEYLQAIKRLDPVYIETYEVINKMGSKELAGSIYEIVRQIYKKSGSLP